MLFGLPWSFFVLEFHLSLAMGRRMPREFSDDEGITWTATETGSYFGYGAVAEGGPLPESSIADVSFRSERGQRVVGQMARGAIDGAPEAQLRDALREAFERTRELE